MNFSMYLNKCASGIYFKNYGYFHLVFKIWVRVVTFIQKHRKNLKITKHGIVQNMDTIFYLNFLDYFLNKNIIKITNLKLAKALHAFFVIARALPFLAESKVIEHLSGAISIVFTWDIHDITVKIDDFFQENIASQSFPLLKNLPSARITEKPIPKRKMRMN